MSQSPQDKARPALGVGHGSHWITCSARLPTMGDANDQGEVWWWVPELAMHGAQLDYWCEPDSATHWMRCDYYNSADDQPPPPNTNVQP